MGTERSFLLATTWDPLDSDTCGARPCDGSMLAVGKKSAHRATACCHGAHPHFCFEASLGDATPLQIHISCFIFSRKASLKLPPGEIHTMQLVSEILTDGFVSAGEPLRVYKLQASLLAAPWQIKNDKGTYVPEDTGIPLPMDTPLVQNARFSQN